MVAYTLIRPLPTPVTVEDAGVVDLTPSRIGPWAGGIIIAATVGLYIVFW